MANMSYCRFENTVRDLDDCLDHITDMTEKEIVASGMFEDAADYVDSEEGDRETISAEEARHREELVLICRKIVAKYDEFKSEKAGN